MIINHTVLTGVANFKNAVTVRLADDKRAVRQIMTHRP